MAKETLDESELLALLDTTETPTAFAGIARPPPSARPAVTAEAR
jgi:hypothetical protein